MPWFKQPTRVLAATCLLLLAAVSRSHAHQRARLQDVSVLTLKHGLATTGRRTSPVPQTKCIGGTAQGLYNPAVIQCYNRGSDGYDTQWECKADLDNTYRFGETTVVCEGYDHPNDPDILVGSCGVEYTLELTKEGRQQQRFRGYRQSNDGYQSHGHHGHHGHHNQGGTGGTSLFSIIVGFIISAMVVSWAIGRGSHTSTSTSTNNNNNPGAPPPYHDSCNGSGGGSGFWSGLLTGGLISSIFRPRYGSGWGSGWGGGWGNTYGSGHSWARRNGSSGWSRPTTSGSRTASGFGGTRRR